MYFEYKYFEVLPEVLPMNDFMVRIEILSKIARSLGARKAVDQDFNDTSPASRSLLFQQNLLALRNFRDSNKTSWTKTYIVSLLP
jgi:hypothetical protein